MKRIICILSGTALVGMALSASATTWHMLSQAPQNSSAICQSVDAGNALIVKGPIGCQETGPWVGWINFSGSPTYGKNTLTLDEIKADLDSPSSPTGSSTYGDTWAKEWHSTKYSNVSDVYYVPATETATTFCGISAPTGDAYPFIYHGTTATSGETWPSSK